MVLRDKVSRITEEEQVALRKVIKDRLEAETKQRERLWRALKVDEGQLDVDLERQYTKLYVLSLVFRFSLLIFFPPVVKSMVSRLRLMPFVPRSKK